jgi:phospholipase/carboxylesterase
MKTFKKEIAGIECVGVDSGNDEVAVVFFHGYGANMQDLLPLWQYWDNGKTNWYFPNGVLSMPMGYYEGRSWFSIDVEALERAMRSGVPRDFTTAVPVELEETLKRQELFLRELAQKHSKIIIGGFSQGAMCASHLAMKKDLNLAGLVLLSGNLLAEKLMPTGVKSLPFYQSHGTKDPVLSIAGARLLEEKLLSLNFQGKLFAFEGGHEIPMDVIRGVKNFLATIEEEA